MKTRDYEFEWFTRKYGSGWETWRELASTFLHTEDYAVDSKRNSLGRFLEEYLAPNFISDPSEFFSMDLQEYSDFLDGYDLSEIYKTSQTNIICDFIEWIIKTYYSEPDDNGDLVALVKSPFKRTKSKIKKIETIYNALPYCYIKQLRSILCPKVRGNFSDWTWAIKQAEPFLDNGRHSRDWLIVEEELLDKSDPDCVWRKVTLDKSRSIRINGALRTYNEGDDIFLLWSPVRAMVLFTKLHLPLRTYQVRMLDSGEADTWRYEKGNWEFNNKHSFVEGNEKHPWKKGIFNRIITPDIGDVMTGMYINTNKTADLNKDESNRGYVIPWQNEDVLYWLEKLRNWQEKFNPISHPTSIHALDYQHFGATKTEKQRNEIGDICFLFRDASSQKDSWKKMPITDTFVKTLWWQLTKKLEDDVFGSGQRLADGGKIYFNDPKNERKTRFPLHSLRVSIITCYSLEGDIPAPVLSKLLVGHTHLIMTMHYHKITPTMMAKQFKDAENKIIEKEDESLASFLQHESIDNIALKSACNSVESIQTALRVRNPAGWQDRAIGICLAGGNTCPIENGQSLAGCYNGGPALTKANKSTSAIHAPVPHGLENCVRCRWFITNIRYLHALTAHFNNLSFHATESANIAAKLEAEHEMLLDEKYFCEVNNQRFTKHDKVSDLERRIHKQKTEADEYCKDLVACFQIIRNLIQIETKRKNGDKSNKVIALGSAEDISSFFSFIDTDSKFRQLIQICDDTEIFTDLRDDLLKSTAIAHRTNKLNTMLMKKGYVPFLMQLDDEAQLAAGNAMINTMLKASKKPTKELAMNHLASYVDTEQYLQEVGLLEEGIKAIETKTGINILRLADIYRQHGGEIKHG